MPAIMDNAKIPFAELLQKQAGSYATYQMLLQTTEWEEKRGLILKRDNHKCGKCGKWATLKQCYDFEKGPQVEDIWFDDSSLDWTSDETGTVPRYKPSEEIFGKNAQVICYNGGMAEIHAGKPYHMEIHHQYYIRAYLPWQYNDEALVTLCNWCHRETHETGAPIPVFPTQAARDEVLRKVADFKQKAFYYTSCSRCGGSGDIPSYKHVEGGVCFRCGGSGYDELRNIKA